ncbi:MAG TPA: phospholipase D-like domain-containing protein [Mycobacteriales bacterium]|nr:phospholipase D-like domain-containing protein [Mycobacteriales bacterium]
MTTTPSTRAEQLRRHFEGLLGIPATEGNEITILRNGDEIFPAMLEAIRGAERTVDFLTFVYWRGDIATDFAEALSERAEKGIRVRVLLDAFGTLKMDRGLIQRMESSGVQVHWFRKPLVATPVQLQHRTHRKVLVVDDSIAFTGGVGIAEQWCGDARDETEWRDSHFRVEGPAVDGIGAAFAQNWAETGRPLCEPGDTFPDHGKPGKSTVIVARGSATIGWNDMSTVFRLAIENAKHQLRLTTAYFMPDEFFEQLLIEAAERGVEVDVLVPGVHADKVLCRLAGESTFERLTSGGVRIWRYEPSMLHAKITTVDGELAVVGSANVNRRSLRHDEEIVMVVFDPTVAATLDEHFEHDLSRAERVSPRRWQDRPVRQRAGEAVTAVMRRWM